MAEETQLQVAHGGGGGHASRGPGGHGGQHEEAHEGAPEWLISFADNVMLQMGFFVILLALAMQTAKTAGSAGGSGPATAEPTPEQLDWAIAVREAFNNPVDVTSTDPRDLLLIRRLVARGDAKAAVPGQTGIEHDVKSIRPSEYSGLGGTVPFDQNAADLSAAAQPAVDELLEHLRGHGNILEVRGHVSAVEAFGTSDRGVALSYARARAVAEALVAGGIGWDRLRLIACGDGERLVREGYDAPGHRENQRVEVIVTDQAPLDTGKSAGTAGPTP